MEGKVLRDVERLIGKSDMKQAPDTELHGLMAVGGALVEGVSPKDLANLLVKQLPRAEILSMVRWLASGTTPDDRQEDDASEHAESVAIQALLQGLEGDPNRQASILSECSTSLSQETQQALVRGVCPRAWTPL